MLRDHQALVAYLHARGSQPFDWAENSCVHFAAGAVEAQTGRDVLKGLPTWKTERGAKLALARLGGLAAATDTVLRRIHPSQAQRGDIAGVAGPDGAIVALMVVEGQTLVGPDASGARRLARARMAVAWCAT